jgi:lysophospholipase L1-like esterase
MPAYRFALMIALVALMISGCAAPDPVASTAKAAAAATGPTRGEAKAVHVAKGPAIDGTLNSPLWARCPPIELGDATSKKPAGLRTTARVLFDPTHLYLAVDCAEPDTDGLKKAVTKRDGPVYSDDSIEFFITGDPRQRYYQFAFNALGTVMDGHFKPGKHMDRSWNSTAEVKASIEKNKRWILTAKFPLKELSAYVGNDQMWSMNLNRNRSGAAKRQSLHLAWSVMEKTDWHAVNDYGMIDGVNIPKRADGVTRVVGAMPKPPKYLQGAEADGVLVYKRVAGITAPDKGKGTQHRMALPIKGSKDLKIAFVARGTNGVKQVSFNLFDARAKDNTTPICYYWVDETWRPLIYRLSEFRYNAVIESRVAAGADFRSLFFHGNKTGGKGTLYMKNFVVYRGSDRTPPTAPKNLKVEETPKGPRLTWDAATDNVGVASYIVSYVAPHDHIVPLAQVSATMFQDGLITAQALRQAARQAMGYRVRAVDFEENVSPWSKQISIRGAPGAPKKLARETRDRLGYAANVAKVHAAGRGKVVKGRVMMFGDSLTYATNYRHNVASALGNYEVIAKGHSRMRTSFGKANIERHLKEVNPEFCLVLFGTNNSKNARSIAAAMADLVAIAKACEKNGTVPVIGTIPPRGFSDPESKPEKTYNAALAKTCRANNIPVAYIFEVHQESGVNRRKLLSGDGVHTIKGGWLCIGQAWRAAMAQVRLAALGAAK